MPIIQVHQCDRCGQRRDEPSTYPMPTSSALNDHGIPFQAHVCVTLDTIDVVLCNRCTQSFSSWWRMAKYLPDQKLEMPAKTQGQIEAENQEAEEMAREVDATEEMRPSVEVAMVDVRPVVAEAIREAIRSEMPAKGVPVAPPPVLTGYADDKPQPKTKGFQPEDASNFGE